MKKLLLIGMNVLICSFLFAQTGAISGTIIDKNNGETLIGANVVIEGTSIGAATDFDGKYQFKADPGVYTIVISYAGYGNKKIEGVEVKANTTTFLDAALSDAAVDLGLDVVVTAKALERSENAILLLQKKSDKIQDGISSQEISRLGAGDAASALTKVTGTTVVDGKYVYVRGLGDRYSSTSLNGTRLPSVDPYRNSAQLDLIPTNLLDNIIASKSFTPDLPGDFTGGSVNIKIKTLPERFTFNVSASAAYNTQASLIDNFRTFDAGNTSWLGLNDGTLDRPAILDDPRLRDMNILDPNAATARARRDDEVAGLVDQAIKSFNNDFAIRQKSTPVDHNFSLSLGNRYELGNIPVGFLLTLNYSNEFAHYENAPLANYVNPGGRPTLEQVFILRDNRSSESPRFGGLAGLSFKFSPTDEVSVYAIYSHQANQLTRYLSGDYQTYGALAPVEFQSQTLSFQQRSLLDVVLNGEHLLQGLGGVRIEWAGNFVQGAQNEPDLRFLASNYDPGRSAYFISPSIFNPPGHFFRELDDQSYEAKVDITIPILQSRNNANKLKFGGLYSNLERDFDENIYSIARFMGTRYAGDPDAYFAESNLGIISKESNGNNVIGLYIDDDTQLSNSYIGDATIWAGYGMLTYQLATRLKLIGGARVEGTDYYIESDQAKLLSDPSTQIGEIDEIDILPAVHLIYNLTDDMNLRASYSNTLARPNLREIAPFGSFGFIGDPTLFGNPDLVRSRINNFDLRYEFFTRPGELFAVSGFYKQFKDPIVQTFRLAGNPQFTWKNSADATLFGAEFEFRKGLDVISPAFQNFTFSTNLALIYSEVALDSLELAINRSVDPDFPETRPFAGQSPYVVNANLSYTDAESGWDAIVAFNIFGDRLSAVGTQGTPDIFEQSRATLDASISKKFGPLTVKLRGRNLLNPEYKTFADFLDQEYLFSSYRAGREIGLSLSYGI